MTKDAFNKCTDRQILETICTLEVLTYVEQLKLSNPNLDADKALDLALKNVGKHQDVILSELANLMLNSR